MLKRLHPAALLLSAFVLSSCTTQSLGPSATVENQAQQSASTAPPKTVDLAALDPALHYKVTVPSNYRIESVESPPHGVSRCLIYCDMDSNPDLEFVFLPHGFLESSLEGAGMGDDEKKLMINLERGNPDLAAQQYLESIKKMQQDQAGLAPKNLGTPSLTPTVVANAPMKKVTWTEQDGEHFAVFGRDDLGDILWQDIPHYDDQKRTAESHKIVTSLTRS